MSQFMLADSNHSPLAAAIREAIGANANEAVEVMTPEFNRPAAWEPAMPAPSAADVKTWGGFTHADRETLRAWGCRLWGKMTTEPPNKPVARVAHDGEESWFYNIDDDDAEDTRKATHELWLFPADWYEAIPNGFPLVSISGNLETFTLGTTDDDRRFEMLAYGVVIEETR